MELAKANVSSNGKECCLFFVLITRPRISARSGHPHVAFGRAVFPSRFPVLPSVLLDVRTGHPPPFAPSQPSRSRLDFPGLAATHRAGGIVLGCGWRSLPGNLFVPGPGSGGEAGSGRETISYVSPSSVRNLSLGSVGRTRPAAQTPFHAVRDQTNRQVFFYNAKLRPAGPGQSPPRGLGRFPGSPINRRALGQCIRWKSPPSLSLARFAFCHAACVSILIPIASPLWADPPLSFRLSISPRASGRLPSRWEPVDNATSQRQCGFDGSRSTWHPTRAPGRCPRKTGHRGADRLT